jgi:hypothetical protein
VSVEKKNLSISVMPIGATEAKLGLKIGYVTNTNRTFSLKLLQRAYAAQEAIGSGAAKSRDSGMPVHLCPTRVRFSSRLQRAPRLHAVAEPQQPAKSGWQFAQRQSRFARGQDAIARPV